MHRHASWRIVGAVAAALLGPAAIARQPSQPDPPADQPPTATASRELPAAVLMGLRAESIRRTLRVTGTLVIVPSTSAYIDALARWTIEARFPILIDDGTDTTQEQIARFVRAFKPESVVRWPGAAAGAEEPGPSMRERIAAAHAAAWGAATPDALPARWKELRLLPVGAVVLSMTDPAWTAGLALAAGRGQPILWTMRAPEPLGAIMPEKDADALSRFIADELDKTGLPWRDPGDTIEAVTLCHNLGGRVQSADGIVALTDFLGRADKPIEPGKPLARSYVVGLIHGDEPAAAYAAMCALFLQPDSAWMLNGYETTKDDAKTKGFAAYNPASAAPILEKIGVKPTVEDGRDPLRGLRTRARDGINAGFIHVSTAGNRQSFMLKGVEAWSSEIPPLRVPAIVHFVHSFSAQDLADPQSIAARWLAGGAYAYVGAVDEPYLNAFVTPETLVQRLSVSAPLAAAARVDTPKPWKINVYGDPLITRGPPAKRAPGTPALPEPAPTPLDDLMKTALREKRLEEATRLMIMLGRDADALRVYQAARAADPKSASAALSLAVFWAACRTPGEAGADAAIDAYLWMPPEHAKAPRTLDALWIALRPILDERPTRKAFDALLPRMRPATVVDDATMLAKAAQRLDGPPAARDVIQRAIQSVPDGPAKQRLQDRLKLF